jgi:hypothetical protein
VKTALFCLAVSAILHYKGTVFSNESGISGSGTGIARVESATRSHIIHYQKPISGRFKNRSCWNIGSIWEVRSADNGAGDEELISADCEGAVDKDVSAAWSLVVSFLRDYGTQKPAAAGVPLIRGLQLDTYKAFGRAGNCLEVVKRDPNQITIGAPNGRCMISFDEQSVSLLFTISRIRGRWALSNIAQSRR